MPSDYAEQVCSLFAQLGTRGTTVFFSSGDDGLVVLPFGTVSFQSFLQVSVAVTVKRTMAQTEPCSSPTFPQGAVAKRPFLS